MKLNQLTNALILSFSLLAFLNVQPAHAADKKELQARFEKRYPQILEFKTQGKIGETTQGLLEIVDSKDSSNTTLSKLIGEENSDRSDLYKLIADDEKTTPDKVAARTAQRNYAKARPGEYLKRPDGKWEKKK